MQKIINYIITLMATTGLVLVSPSLALASPAVGGTDCQILRSTQYLNTQQSITTGEINGFGGNSDWSSIGLVAAGLDPASFSNQSGPTIIDYLVSNPLDPASSATTIEKRILAINALGQDPQDFYGIDYLDRLLTTYQANQLGDPSLLNDDIFGIIALIGSGQTNQAVLLDSLNYLITNQSPDGGFGYSLSSGSDTNDTASALVALISSKQADLAHSNLDLAISNAVTYLLNSQNTDGGFGYLPGDISDGSSTTWNLIALNAISANQDVQSYQELASQWLTSNQLGDGGFGYLAEYGSDTYTTSHAIIALTGNTWLNLRPIQLNCPDQPIDPIQPVVEDVSTDLPNPSTQAEVGEVLGYTQVTSLPNTGNLNPLSIIIILIPLAVILRRITRIETA